VRPSALAFLVVLLAAAAAWAVLVLPVHGKAADLASRIQGEDIGARAAAASAPTAEQARLLEEGAAALEPGPATPAPRGMSEETAGTFTGRLPWTEVQGLLSWSADQPRAVLELEVKALPDDPKRASCRVVFAP
jgi:hypothetical protein